MGELVILRYIHFNRLFPLEYPKLALQICHNFYQNQYLLYKEKKQTQEALLVFDGAQNVEI